MAYNDEPNMHACLSSLHWADELIVVDSFSTDATAKISLEYTDKVFQHEFQGFGKLRNDAMAHASHDWVFSLDTDERANGAIHDEIRKKITRWPSRRCLFCSTTKFFSRAEN